MRMDLDKLIEKLTKERAALDQIIAALDELRSAPPPVEPVKKRRGRKFMDAADRQEVSARMKKYWASRRARS
jgi:hypothetical protein